MKKKIMIISTILIVLITTTLLYLKKQKTIKKIKNNYNDYVMTVTDTNLYNENHEIIGTISENTYLELEKTNIKTAKDIYFKIKNTNYYILNTDIKKQKQIAKTSKEYYLNLEKQITTNNPTTFYKNNEIAFTINDQFNFDITKIDDNYYYVTFLNNEYQIKPEEITEIKDIKIQTSAQYISVIHYNKIAENCTEIECTTTENFKKQLNTLKENGNYTITIDEFKKWLNNNINLKEKAILITSNEENLNELARQYDMNIETNTAEIKFIDTNAKNEKNNATISRYIINQNTNDEIFKQIIDGEPITYTKQTPVTQTHTLPDINANATQIAVLNYHFFFDPEKGETCPDGNCKTVQDFEQELNYLKQNNYKTLTMEEFTKWMYNEIELPARSVLITIDDGAMGTGTHNGNKLIPLLEKYQSHATLFLITGWWPIGNYSSPYLDIESHTFDMHEGNYCQTEQRGSKLLCSTKEQVTTDLKKSIEITNSKKAFCFPMYVYNETTLQVLKELDFKLGFVGGDYKATRNNEKYKIPRYHIYRETSLDQFINMIS